jgi:TctA family transporter
MAPYRMLFPCIVLLCCIGAYSGGTSVVEVLMTAFFAVLGYLFVKLGCEPAPLLLGYVLGPLMEENLRRTLMISRGDPSVLVQRPISLCLLIAAGVLLLLIVLPQIRRTRAEAFQG